MSIRLFAMFVSALLCGLLLWGLIPLLRHRLLDHPNARSSHNLPIPRGGGIAFVFLEILASCSALPLVGLAEAGLTGVPLFCLPMAIVGLLDDRHDLSALFRYGIQTFTAILLILVSPLSLNWFMLPLLVIVVTAIINFTNFMDGLDGLVAGCMAVSITTLAIKVSAAWNLYILVGGLVGFLFWNWSPAKVFMGDVGSTFLGAVFAGFVLQSSSWLEALGLLLVATPLFGDASLCVLRRLQAGQHVFQAHRLHLFQRLHQAGWGHARVSITYIAATVALSISLLLGGISWVIGVAFIELLAGVWLDKHVAVSFFMPSQR